MTRQGRYKASRRPARAKGLKIKGQVTEAEVTTAELKMALWAIGEDMGIAIGRLADYDARKDRFTVIAKDLLTGIVADYTIPGGAVAVVVRAFRLLGGHSVAQGAAH